MKHKIAFITGVTGQDGSYLAEFLLNKNYIVHGIRRINSNNNLNNLKKILNSKKRNRFKLHYGDITDSTNLHKILSKVRPQEVYNLAAQSHVHVSFQIPEYTHNVNALGCLKLLEAIKNLKINCKFYQASTSELFGNNGNKFQSEKTPFTPISPYSISKLYAFNLVNYYKHQGMFACNGILFNHESPRRGDSFVTQKIINAALRIKNNSNETLKLGNLYAKRDWGYAKEYVIYMWKMLQLKKPENLVIANGKTYSVKEFVNKVFLKLDMPIKWQGKGINEIGINKLNNKILVKIDPYYFRKIELNNLYGDASKAKKLIKFNPKVSLDQLIDIMIEKKDIDI